MKQALLFFSAAALLIACGENKQPATEKETLVKAVATETTSSPPDSATMMKNFMAYMTPGKEHAMMASWNGKWNVEITSWMAPEAPPSKVSGTMTSTMLLGGRYQQTVNKATWDGMPFEGISTLAFDNVRKVFVSTWIDNMGTGIMTGEGPWDEAARAISIKGKMMDPSIGKEVDYSQVYKIVDENTQVMELYAPVHGGKDFKTMEIRYTRKK